MATRVSSGITKAFEHVEEAIILEDDTRPSPFFFQYCASLLEYWRRDEKTHISGINFLRGKSGSGDSSYYIHRHPSIGGWATWKRAWNHYDLRLPYWPWHQKMACFNGNLYTDGNQAMGSILTYITVMMIPEHGTTTGLRQPGSSLDWPPPLRQGLVTNLGFGQDATHTDNAKATDLPIDPEHIEDHHSSTRVCCSRRIQPTYGTTHLWQPPQIKLRRGLSK